MTKLTVIGPNLTAAQQRKGEMHVHAKGCRDIARQYLGDDKWTDDFDSVRDVIESLYSDQIAESDDDWTDYRSSVYFLPCCGDLPEGDDDPDPVVIVHAHDGSFAQFKMDR